MIQRLIATAILTLAALPAQAQEHAPEAAALSPFAGNVGNAIWTLAIFLLVVTILGKFAWGPVLALLQERERFIHKSLADAKRDREEAEARLREYAARIQTARAEAGAIVEEARRDAERLRDDLKQRARTEADTMVQNAE
jgi:F-type H+-transporting ATPase subunit b